ncbi:MAG: ATP-binding cassette domain-containing protein [Solirubrobacterales bacterium]
MDQSQSTAQPSGTDSGSQPLLALKGFTKSFGPVAALTDVDFDVSRGEVVALVGDNGAGKSTLIKAVSGAQPPDSGDATWDGRPARLRTPHDATSLGIATVYQDLALAENLDVVANLFLGQEEIAGTIPGVTVLDETAMEKKAVELLSSLGVTTLRSVRTEVAMLSGGQRQAVAIARSLLGDPELVMLDEPTAALGIVQTAQILKLIKRLRDRGLGVIVISHNLANVFEVADRIVVLRLGRLAATFEAEDTSRERIVASITGADEQERATEDTQL